MSFVTKPVIFEGDGVYIDSQYKTFEFLRYGLWIPLAMEKEKATDLKVFLKKHYPQQYEQLKKSIF